MRHIIVLQHVPHEVLGSLEASLRRADLEWRYVELFRDVPANLGLDHASGLVILGGPMNVDQTRQFPFLEKEVGWIRDAIERELPVLGICLGSQLLAKTLGGSVFANPAKEIGWYPLELTSAAQTDPLFRQLHRDLTVFQWHGDTFELPRDAVQLARSPICENQAFRYGDRTFGLQFHIEVTAAMISQWLEEPENRRELAELDDIDVSEIRIRTPQELPALAAIGQRAFDRFGAICRDKG